MKTTSRRGLLGAGAALALSGTAQAASPGETDAPKFLFPLPVDAVPIVGSDQAFPVRRIYCIGRNYPEHAREQGSDPTKEPPFFFQKPSDAVQYVAPGMTADHPYPTLTKNYHHEIELIAFLKSGGRNIPPELALDHVYGYAIGLDMTRRDLQREMGNQKKPWEIGKSFDHSAPMGPVHPVALIGHKTKGAISLAVNGEVRQNADLADMTWSVAEQIAHLSTAFALKAGDLIYSGTPANVGPVVKGDVLLGKIDGLPDLSIRIV
jgi:2-keto-4-pentenoate hydratase/2-oxohepta-3-ene-1,7-dioic acid hydratase in catechol pathway